ARHRRRHPGLSGLRWQRAVPQSGQHRSQRACRAALHGLPGAAPQAGEGSGVGGLRWPAAGRVPRRAGGGPGPGDRDLRQLPPLHPQDGTGSALRLRAVRRAHHPGPRLDGAVPGRAAPARSGRLRPANGRRGRVLPRRGSWPFAKWAHSGTRARSGVAPAGGGRASPGVCTNHLCFTRRM
ncbi:MAG: hypothetical protein AVDCRST_MAG77-2885, partial [uncultured Chloroflexi bacterium]